VRALADRIGHYAVDAHGGKQDRNARKDSEQLHIEPVITEGPRQSVFHGHDVGDGG
jgi:hypothetical protein